MKDLFVGIDLHSNNYVVGILDINKCRIAHKKFNNTNKASLENFLSLYNERIREIAVESTFNWYWMVDALIELGYKVNLVHPPRVVQYNGLKYTDDKHDAFFLAELMLLGILPTGYIYPRELRGLRDLNRKHRRLIQERTTHILSLKSFLNRQQGLQFTGYKVKTMTEEEIENMFSDSNLQSIGNADIRMITHLTHLIRALEKEILDQVKLTEEYTRLLTIPGIGKALAVTILLEVGDIRRFPEPGDYVSYCRQVESRRESNKKSKGSNNKKNGNKYLSWVYMEAACKAKRYSPGAGAYFNKKAKATHVMVAYKSLGAKIAWASYHMLKNNVDYNEAIIFPKP